MNICADYGKNSKRSRPVRRVVAALYKFMPDQVQLVKEKAADLAILHVSGNRDHTLIKTRDLLASGREYAVIQYSLASTRNPDPRDWLEIWQGARCVWSYYDLFAICRDAGILEGSWDINFYYAPMGADPEIFQPKDQERDLWVITTGAGWLQESVREIARATMAEPGRVVVHVGCDLQAHGLESYRDVTNTQLVGFYNRAHYVSGLRRDEGFELPAVEGLFCGARPVVYDRPHFRRWYAGLAAFVPETHRAQIELDLIELFNGEYRPVTEEEIELARVRFEWSRIVEGFVERLG